ncbi:isopeptide-forming domain-containing fimbrial protein, partial [Streptococcus sp. 20-1249]|uniref:isopeptide-forming domain-containing fimbrial protein n=1 Tax=Streptococcus hepaticus TaxID=3349163 RepID=UPI0037482944
MNKRKIRRLTNWFASAGTALALGIGLVGGVFASAADSVVSDSSLNTTTKQEGCAIKVTTTQKVEWKMPRQPIDLVVLQDNSGSFKDTIDEVQEALKTLTTPLAPGEKYDETNPKLVFTGDPETTDRVMINTYRGIDITNYTSNFRYDPNAPAILINRDTYLPGYISYGQFVYDTRYEIRNVNGYYVNGNYSTNNPTPADDYANTVYSARGQVGYQYTKTPLMSTKNEVDAAINSFVTGGGTPTVPAIDDTITEYNRIKGDMSNNRKTVFLLITDGVANGYRKPGSNTVYIDRSLDRQGTMHDDWGLIDSQGYKIWTEAAQPYVARANELKEKGADLKAQLGENATVVVGFWEDKAQFLVPTAYYKLYENEINSPASGISGLSIEDTRPARTVVNEAIRSVASDDKVLPTGEKASFYVNEQDINRFSEQVLKAVTSALVKEDVSGEFTVTKGYTVDSVTINKKKVVEEVKDPDNEIRGKVVQNGDQVTISVPESVFNPGQNDFDYELKYTEDSPTISLADENNNLPPDDYAPTAKEQTVGQLVGKFKVGSYESAEIGSKTPTSVTVTDLKYCYPRATKSIKDADAVNDTKGDDGITGNLANDPLLEGTGISRKSYVATLGSATENFTYTVDYNMYNAALEMKKNVMFADQLNYHLDYVNAYVTDKDGKRLPDFTVSTKATQDTDGNETTTVIANVPPKPGIQNEKVDEGKYGGHAFKLYKLVIEAKIKEKYLLNNDATEYYKIMQDNNGLGLANQASIIWNGDSDDPADKTAKVRNSNNVFVAPPLETDIKKYVTQSLSEKGTDHLELPTRLDEYYYQIESTWPGVFDTYVIEDLLVAELQSLNSAKEDRVFVNGVEAPTLSKYIKVTQEVQADGTTRDLVKFEINKAGLTRLQLRQINNEITKLNQGNDGPAKITLGIKAQIRDGAVLAKYADDNGKIKVPNDAKVTLDGKSKKSNEVTVSPNSPAAVKRINKDKTELFTTVDEKGLGQEFNYDVQATLPADIATAKEYFIKDVLDDRLELVPTDIDTHGANDGVYMVDVDADKFTTEVKTEDGKQVVYARMKEEAFSQVKAGDVVHLVLHARVKQGATGTI